jgi:hypothetical protein
MWQAVGWICSLVGLACSSVPNVAVIQTAYEREAAAGSKLHDKDLQVLTAKCHDNSDGPILCEVTFISNKDPNKGDERLYFDIVAVASTTEGWELKSGLCKGPKPRPTATPNGAADR